MQKKLPILIIIPHGGIIVPDELSGYEKIDRFGIFIDSDACANQIFRFEGVAAKLDTHISRLFVDLDRNMTSQAAGDRDSIIKKESVSGREVFKEGVFPDDVAVFNIVKRYYSPFHNAAEKIISSGEIKLIIECRTMMPVGQRNAPDAGKPRPVISIENKTNINGALTTTCPDKIAVALLEHLERAFTNEGHSATQKFIINDKTSKGYIIRKYGDRKIPMVKLSLSTSLYLTEQYFNYDYLTIDETRLDDIRNKLWNSIEKFYHKNF